MNKLIPLVVSAVIGFGGLSWAQEVPRTQDELAKLPIYKRVLDDTDSTNANELGKRYDEALSSENWEEARKCAQALLELRINKQGADHYEVIDARQLLDDLEILLKLTTEERSQLRDAARQEQQMGTLYREGQYAKAIEIGQQVLTTRKLLLGENHPAYADSLSYLGNQYLAIGDYPSAEKLYLQSDHFYRSLQRENHPDYAMNLSNMAVLYRSMGEYAKSESLYLRARDIRQQLLGEENAYLANSLSNLAILYDSMGAYAKAETLHFRARELRAKQYGENHLMYANSLNSIGLSYFNKGDYAKAEPLLAQARDLTSKLLGENHPSYAINLNNLAGVLRAKGEALAAEQLFKQAMDLRKSTLGENHPLYAESLNNLAALYSSIGQYEVAESLYLHAHDLRMKRLGVKHPEYASSLNNLGLLYLAKQEYAKAEPMLVEAIDLAKNVLGENHPYYTSSLTNLGLVYMATGENTKAEQHLVRAVGKIKTLKGESHPDYAQCLNSLAVLYLQMEEYRKAEQLLLDCTRSFEMSRIARAGGFQRAIGGKGQNPYYLLASLSARLNNPRQAFVALERNLARGLLDLRAERRGQSLSSEQQSQRDRILQELSPIEKRITVLAGRAELTDDEQSELAERIAARVRLDVEMAEVAAELSTQEVSDLSVIQRVIPKDHALLSWVDVNGDKGRGEVKEHWACVLTSNGEPLWVPLPGTGDNGKWTDEDQQVPTKVREALAQPVPPSNLPELIEQLRRQRIEPVLAPLKDRGISQLYIVSIEEMAGLPVEVIAPEFTISYVPSGTFLARLPGKPDFDNALFAVGDPIYEVRNSNTSAPIALPPHGLLINALAPGGSAEGLGLQPGQVLLQYAETKLTTIDDLKAAVQKAAGAGDKNAFVTVWKLDDKDQPSESIVAFPVGPLGVILAPEPAPVAIDSRRKNETLLAGLRGGENWKDLPGTRYEVQQLRSLFPTATVLLDGEANEAAVDAMRQTGKLGQFRFLHFATHGKGNSIAAFESKLILSQDQVKGEIKPGEPWYNNEVSAQEVLDYWKLNADLVTLSACQTGLGRQGGGEGLLGFAQAFLLSGARSVCLSLWEVDDIATALLMQRFYQNLRGEREGLMSPMPKAKALAEAKQWLRNLSAKDATTLTAKLTGGIARGNRGSKVFKLPEPTVLEEEVVDDDYKPFARPHYWSAFILIGDPE